MEERTRAVEFRGRTVDEATQRAAAELGLPREQLDVQVLHEGSRGVFGVGASDAVIRVSPLAAPAPTSSTAPAAPTSGPVYPAPASPPPTSAPSSAVPGLSQSPGPRGVPSAAAPASAPSAQPPASAPGSTRRERATPAEVDQFAQEFLTKVLTGMGLPSRVDVQHPPAGPEGDGPELVLDIVGRDLGVLIGRRGETLRDLEFITRLAVATHFNHPVRLSLDVEGYRSRRERILRELAKRMADRVRQNRQPITLEAMPPNERRIVHITLRESTYVRTESIGEGDHRRVTILPK